MGIRETLNKNAPLAGGIAAGVIVLVILLIWLTSSSSGPTDANQQYYTVDDGKSYFKDVADQIVPYDYKGKEAVRAHVYKVNGKTQVVWMERLAPPGKQAMEKLKNDPPSDQKMMNRMRIENAFRQVKKPGDANWVFAAQSSGVVENAVNSDGTPAEEMLP